MFGDADIAEFDPDNPVATDYMLGRYFGGDPERDALKAETMSILADKDMTRTKWNLPPMYREAAVAAGAIDLPEEEEIEAADEPKLAEVSEDKAAKVKRDQKIETLQNKIDIAKTAATAAAEKLKKLKAIDKDTKTHLDSVSRAETAFVKKDGKLKELEAELRKAKAPIEDIGRALNSQVELKQQKLDAQLDILSAVQAEVNVRDDGLDRLAKQQEAVRVAKVELLDAKQAVRARLALDGMAERNLGSAEGAGLDTTGFNMDFAYLEKYMEVPMLNMNPVTGEWKAPTKWLPKVMQGDADPRLYRLLEQREAMARTGKNIAEDWRKRFNKAIKETWPDGNVDSQLLNRAFGSSRARSGGRATLTTEQKDALAMEAAEEARRINLDGSLDKDARQLERDALKVRIQKKRDDLMEKNYLDLRDDRSAALVELSALNPELAAMITSARTKFIDQMAKKMEGLFDVRGGKPGKDGEPLPKLELAMHADKNGGIYITRQMEVHRDPDIISKVKSGDVDYVARYEKAVNFVRTRMIKSIARDFYANSPDVTSMEQAMNKASKAYDDTASDTGVDMARAAVDKVLHGYKRRSQESTFRMLRNSDKGFGGQLSESDKLLETKTDMDETIQELLGEYTVGERAQPVDAFVGTMSLMFSSIAQQQFLHNLKEVGVRSGWLVDGDLKKTSEQTVITEDMDDEQKKKVREKQTKYKGWVKLKSSDAGDFWDHNPLKDMYMPSEASNDLRNALQDVSITHDSSEAAKAMTQMQHFMLKATGISMGMKTLGSVGFYLRNVLSNAMFFGPAQGFLGGGNPLQMWDEASASVRGAMGAATLTDYRAKLMALGIITESLHSDMFEKVMRGQVSGQDLVTRAMDEAQRAAKKGAGATAPLRALSNAVDSYYKMAYFESELKVLQQAKEAGGIHEQTGREWSSFTQTELEFMAADIVKATAQSIDRAPQLVKKAQGNLVTAMVAPFFRFTSEVPRIAINTFKLWNTDRKSSNPVIRARAARRLAGMMWTVAVSTVLPAAMAAAMGISDEEEEALRASMPSYLRNNSFFFAKVGGKLVTLDFTYLNPFAMLLDPFTRTFDDTVNGRFDSFIGTFATAMIGNTYLDSQILADAVIDVQRNVNQTLDEPIWEETDSTAGKVTKALSHILTSAYEPRQVEGLRHALTSLNSDAGETEPLKLFFKSWAPMRPHEVDFDKQLRRYLYEMKEQYDRAGKNKYALRSSRGLTPRQARNAYRDEVAGKLAVNKAIYEVAVKGFGGFMSEREIAAAMKGTGMGKDRIKLLFNRMMDRPVYSPDYVRQLRADPTQSARLDHAIEEYFKTSRFIPLDD